VKTDSFKKAPRASHHAARVAPYTAAEVSRLQHLPSAKELLSKHRVEMQLAALNELVLTAASVADPASTSYVVSVAAAEDAGRESALHFTPPR